MSNPRIRASDADRDRTAALLREHLAAGRLTAEEFNDRLDRTYAARTLGELDDILMDLPAIDLYQLPDASLHRRRPSGGYPLPWLMAPGAVSRLSPQWKAAWGSWLSVSLVCFVVWLLSGHPGNLWFLWVAGPWGALMLGRWLTGAPPRRRPDRRGGEPDRRR